MKNTPAAVLVATFTLVAACKTLAPTTDSGSSDVTGKGGTSSGDTAAGAGPGPGAPSTTDGAGLPGSSSSSSSTTSSSGSTSDGDGGTADCPGAAATYDATLAASGKDLVQSYGCANCHQANLAGQTTSIRAGQSIFPKNLTPDRATGLGCWTEDQVVNAILNGIDDQGETLCVMPQFAARGMDADSAHAIANYLRSLPAANHDVPESVCAAPAGDPDGG
jgi:hypothetical protein